MDVGFNNTNTFEEKELQDVVFLVEATNEEKHNLWREYSKEYVEISKIHQEIPIIPTDGFDVFERSFLDKLSLKAQLELSALKNLTEQVIKRNNEIRDNVKYRVDWKQISMGFWLEIGKVNKKPVCISFSFAKINGHKIAFYEPTSQAVDHEIVDKYLTKHFQRTHDGYTRWNHVNATNFHNCVNSLDNLDIEPRNTVYKNV